MLIINIICIALIVFIIWWFWIYKPNETILENHGQAVKVANGIYQPSFIKIPAHTEITLAFIREDESPCAEMLQFPELEINETLPLNKIVKIKIPALKEGVYDFHCQMKMYKGQLRVEK
ncbi:cupredoxin domain-containing protein [Litoribacillus peritrichatus]|uniref:Cupredoxin domain-containing protein n=1 Tax=Litoribacillus peritrichatus TaxID=718191 RepID=A0ABP7MT03_9GAMM